MASGDLLRTDNLTGGRIDKCKISIIIAKVWGGGGVKLTIIYYSVYSQLIIDPVILKKWYDFESVK